MRVSDEHRVLFVHVPKNAGSTIDWAFDQAVPDARRVPSVTRHASLEKVLIAEPDLADYWTFGFVRNPWARMVSWYSMMRRVFKKEARGRPKAVDKIARKPAGWDLFRPVMGDFETFVMEGTSQIPRMSLPQLDWLETSTGRQADFIGRVESFHTDFAVVCARLQIVDPTTVPRRNKSRHRHYSEYYTEATRQRVAEVYARDIEAFGYTFETSDTSRLA
jgi:hypothetical protein